MKTCRSAELHTKRVKNSARLLFPATFRKENYSGAPYFWNKGTRQRRIYKKLYHRAIIRANYEAAVHKGQPVVSYRVREIIFISCFINRFNPSLGSPQDSNPRFETRAMKRKISFSAQNDSLKIEQNICATL